MVLYKIKIIIITGTSTLASPSETPFKYRALVTYYDNLFVIMCYD